jgi:hypothetical protein
MANDNEYKALTPTEILEREWLAFQYKLFLELCDSCTEKSRCRTCRVFQDLLNIEDILYPQVDPGF